MTPRRENRFQSTNWSLVQKAARSDPRQSSEALTRLCEAYWPPVYAFVRRNGFDENDALDLTQTYFAHLFENEILRNIVPRAGRFRSFLLTSLKNMMNDERDKWHAQKRGGGRVPIPLDMNTAERGYRIQPADDVDPDVLFERRWATTVLQRVLDRLRDQMSGDEAAWRFERLKALLTGERPAPSYRQLATDLDISENAVKMAVSRLRKRYGELLRVEIAATLSSDDDVDDEIRHLLSVVRY